MTVWSRFIITVLLCVCITIASWLHAHFVMIVLSIWLGVNLYPLVTSDEWPRYKSREGSR